jgi:hypothetical protein
MTAIFVPLIHRPMDKPIRTIIDDLWNFPKEQPVTEPKPEPKPKPKSKSKSK